MVKSRDIVKWNRIMLTGIGVQFKAFLSNPTFLAGLTSWFLAQFIKTLINLLMSKVKTAGELVDLLFWRTGGMPSSHSALVTSLCTTIAIRNGLNSDVFFISFVFLLVVVRDSFGVRRASGIQAKKINEIGASLKEKAMIDEYTPIKEVNGHTPIQVIFGCLLGFIVGLAFTLLK